MKKGHKKIVVAVILIGLVGGAYCLDEYMEEKNVNDITILESGSATRNEELLLDDNLYTYYRNSIRFFWDKYQNSISDGVKYTVIKSDSVKYPLLTEADMLSYVEILPLLTDADIALARNEMSLRKVNGRDEFDLKREELLSSWKAKTKKEIIENEEPIFIKDIVVKQAIIETLDLNTEEVYFKDMIQLDELSLEGQVVTSLEGLEYAVNLEKLDLSDIHNKININEYALIDNVYIKGGN